MHSQMHRNAINFLNTISGLSWKEIDYSQAIKNENTIVELKKQEDVLNETISKLERDILKSKLEYDKLTTKLEELQVITLHS